MSLRPADELGGYRLVTRLGGGATSDIWLAEAAAQHVAVKVYQPHLFQHSARAREKRLAQEAAVSRVAHRNLCRIHSWGRGSVRDQRYRFVVMEFVDGTNLEQIIRGGGPLSRATFRSVALQLVDAVEALHDAGMLHRDIKPANVIVERGTDRVVLVDFGVVADLVAALIETSVQTFLGTLPYAAPEWVYRDPPAAADAAPVDIYGLGATFFEMMTGRRPFADVTNAAALARLVRDHTPELTAPTYDPDLQALVRLMLAKRPDMRPSLGEIRQGIAAASG